MAALGRMTPFQNEGTRFLRQTVAGRLPGEVRNAHQGPRNSAMRRAFARNRAEQGRQQNPQRYSGRCGPEYSHLRRHHSRLIRAPGKDRPSRLRRTEGRIRAARNENAPDSRGAFYPVRGAEQSRGVASALEAPGAIRYLLYPARISPPFPMRDGTQHAVSSAEFSCPLSVCPALLRGGTTASPADT